MNYLKNYQELFQAHKPSDYTNIDFLTKYISEQGKIMPKRITGLNRKQQKQVTKNIKKARILSFVPFINK